MASTSSFRQPFNPNQANSGTVRPFIRPPTSFYVFQPRPSVPAGYQNAEFDGKRLRKAVARKTVDYNSSIVKMLEARVWQRDYRDCRAIQPDIGYYTEILPPMGMKDNPANCVTTKFVRTSTNKMRCPIFCVLWTPEGRRLVTGASSGEFTLWNGLTFNFETILQAHDSAVKAMVWSRSDSWMVTADQTGYVKYWQSNMNNVKMFQAHKEPIRAISFCPTDTKFATCSDDGTIRIWDFLRCLEERILRGHGADVKGVDWHPTKALIASGSKDSQQPVKLWDPKTGQSLATLHAHKNTVTDIKWNQNGNWLLTSSRDHLIKIFDIRNMSCEMQSFRGHKKEVSCLSWHPIHEGLFASGGSDGSILFWLVGTEKEIGSMEQAHDSIVWSLSWHPLGHILTSGSNDHSCKFWTRNRPGDRMRDKYNLNLLPKESEEAEFDDDISTFAIPGMGFGDKQSNHLEDDGGDASSSVIPGFGFDRDEDGPTVNEPAQVSQLPILSNNNNNNRNSNNNNYNNHSSKERKVPFSKPIPKQFQQQWNSDAKLPPSNNNNSNSRRNDHSFYSQSQQFDNNNSQQPFNNNFGPPPPQQLQNNSNINRFPNPPPNQEFYSNNNNNPNSNNNPATSQLPPAFQQPPPHLGGPPPPGPIPHPQPYFNGNNNQQGPPLPPVPPQQFPNQPPNAPHVYSDYSNNQNNNGNNMPPPPQLNYSNNNGPNSNPMPYQNWNQNPSEPFPVPPHQQQQGPPPIPPQFQNQQLPPPLFGNANNHSNFNQGPPPPHQANFGPHGFQANNNADNDQRQFDQQHPNYPSAKRVRS